MLGTGTEALFPVNKDNACPYRYAPWQVHAAVAEQELNRLAASGELPSDRLPGQLEAVRTAREECTSLQQQWLRTVATLEPEAIRESLLADWAGKSATSVYAMARSLERILEVGGGGMAP